MKWVQALFIAWRGKRCPECNVRPLKQHRDDCSIGKWDGGVWA